MAAANTNHASPRATLPDVDVAAHVAAVCRDYLSSELEHGRQQSTPLDLRGPDSLGPHPLHDAKRGEGGARTDTGHAVREALDGQRGAEGGVGGVREVAKRAVLKGQAVSEQDVVAVMESLAEAARLAHIDVRFFWQVILDRRPSSALSEAVEREVELRAIRRMGS